MVKVNTTACAELFKDSTNYTRVNETTNVCAGQTPGQSACSGDSGGPLMRVINNTSTIEGIIKSGKNICEPKERNNEPVYPNIFIKVVSFKPWIDEHVESF